MMNFSCPLDALPGIAAQLRLFGVTVDFEDSRSGEVASIAGRLRFSHSGDVLSVSIVEDFGHFPKAMIFGGIRQVVEEVVEGLV
jgi:hypothetical protein